MCKKNDFSSKKIKAIFFYICLFLVFSVMSYLYNFDIIEDIITRDGVKDVAKIREFNSTALYLSFLMPFCRMLSLKEYSEYNTSVIEKFFFGILAGLNIIIFIGRNQFSIPVSCNIILGLFVFSSFLSGILVVYIFLKENISGGQIASSNNKKS